jgi:hypothetical protein
MFSLLQARCLLIAWKLFGGEMAGLEKILLELDRGVIADFYLLFIPAELDFTVPLAHGLVYVYLLTALKTLLL